MKPSSSWRDLRFWLWLGIRLWCGSMIGAGLVWGVQMLGATPETYPYLLSAGQLAYYMMFFVCMVGFIFMVSVHRIYLPLQLSFGVTRRTAFLGMRLLLLLPILLNVLLSIGLSLLLPGGKDVFPLLAPVALTGLAVGSLGDLFGVLSTRGAKWYIVTMLFVGLTCGAFGGMIGFLISGGVEETGAFVSLALSFRGAVIWCGIAAAVIVVENLISAFLFRRLAVKF